VAAVLMVGWRVQGRWSRPAAVTDARKAAPVSPAPPSPVGLPPQSHPAVTQRPIVSPPIEQPGERVQPSAIMRPPAAATVRETAAPIGQEPARPHVRRAPPSEAAVPFDALLGTVLYSPDRKLAIIDGRIVAPGDEVRGARVIDITHGTVTLRDGQGRIHKLTMHTKAR
jgi:hypothetical protein